jgi:membrane protease subunit (stomatin/prohibitin family)
MEISTLIEGELAEEFDDYGLQLKSFKVMSISVPEDDPSFVMLKEAKASAAKRKIEGFTYTQQRSFDVMETAAGNEGGAAGTMVGAGVGLGVGLGVGGQMGNMVGQTMNTGGTPPQPPAASPPNPFGGAAAGTTFHVLLNGEQKGPYGTDILQQGVSTGQMNGQTMVWRAGMAQWLPAGQVPELANLFAGAAPPPPPPPTNAPPAPPTPPAPPADTTEE